MVRTLDLPGEVARLLLADPRAAVAADVVVGAAAALAVAEDDDALFADLLPEPVARIRDPVLAANAEPALGEDKLQLLGEELGRGIVFSGQGPRVVD
jgi:hypothetical protein